MADDTIELASQAFRSWGAWMSRKADELPHESPLGSLIEGGNIVEHAELYGVMNDYVEREEASAWVSVRDRLPIRGSDTTDEGEVLVTDGTEIAIAAACGHCPDTHWIGVNGMLVTHWRRLPALPAALALAEPAEGEE